MKKYLWLACVILFPLLSSGESSEQELESDELCDKDAEPTKTQDRCSREPSIDSTVVSGRAVRENEYRELELRRQLNTTADVDMPDDI